MGLYPSTRVEAKRQTVDGGETWTEVYDNYSGVVRQRTVTAGPWTERERTDCFCCSCDDHSIDVSCRNHGGAHGARPCETHNMPGTDCDCGCGTPLPDSVQTIRRRRAELDSANRVDYTHFCPHGHAHGPENCGSCDAENCQRSQA